MEQRNTFDQGASSGSLSTLALVSQHGQHGSQYADAQRRRRAPIVIHTVHRAHKSVARSQTDPMQKREKAESDARSTKEAEPYPAQHATLHAVVPLDDAARDEATSEHVGRVVLPSVLPGCRQQHSAC